MAVAASAAQAGSPPSSPPRGCDRAQDITATQQDRLLRFAAVVREALAASGATAALISRSGTDLSRFGLRYSHAGIALATGLADGRDMPWAVRQLYYACAEGAPRLFDQGLAGFISGSDDAPRRLREPAAAAARSRDAAGRRGAGQALGAGPAERALQRQRLPVQHRVPELQPVGGRADRRRRRRHAHPCRRPGLAAGPGLCTRASAGVGMADAGGPLRALAAFQRPPARAARRRPRADQPAPTAWKPSRSSAGRPRAASSFATARKASSCARAVGRWRPAACRRTANRVTAWQ